MSNKISNPIAFLKLSQATTVCFDKETALCDGEILIKKVVILDVRRSESEVSQAISNVLNAVNERNPLIDALKKQYDFELSTEVKKVYPFNYQTRSMGASFRGGKAYFIGLVDNMPIKNKPGILKRCEEYVRYGQDVYVLGQGDNESTDNLDVIALIITKEHVRESMVESIKWLN
jgi:cation transport ATPase